MKKNIENAYKVSILTLFPEIFPGPLGVSLIGKALSNKIWDLNLINIRDFANDKHRSVDDTPYGGGAGMVMRPDIIELALNATSFQNQIRCLLCKMFKIKSRFVFTTH